MLTSITQPIVFHDIVDLNHANQLQESVLAFGVQLARRGDKYLMDEYYAAFGVTKEQLSTHIDSQNHLTCL